MTPAPEPRPQKRATVFGVPLDLLTMEETVAECVRLIGEQRFATQTSLNAGKVVMLRDDRLLVEAVREADLVSADGQGVVWGVRFLGLDVPERVAGIDLMERLLVECADREWPAFFLGAKAEVLERFLAVVGERFPSLRVCGARNGYFTDDRGMADEIRASGARVLFVGISSPRKEQFIAGQRDYLGPVFAMGVGGSFDVWAGETSRAPLWMQRAGLEWFYRLVQEPRRMWRRYLVGNARFAAAVIRERTRGGSKRG